MVEKVVEIVVIEKEYIEVPVIVEKVIERIKEVEVPIKQEVEDRQTQTARIEHENQVKREENRLKDELEIKQHEEETETQVTR